MRKVKEKLLSDLELAERLGLGTLLKVSPGLSSVKTELPYKGSVFTVAVATVILNKDNGRVSRLVSGEGVSRRSFLDPTYREWTASNVARERALEALDKKLRRQNGHIGHRYEG